MALKRGKVVDKFCFSVDGVLIPSNTEKLILSILLPLLVYEVTMLTVEILERKINCYLQRWLGLPRSLTSAALYGKSNKLQLSISCLRKEFKVSLTRKALVYRDSKVASAGIEVRMGRKWKGEEGIEMAECLLRHRALVDTVAVGRAGLRVIHAASVCQGLWQG